MKTWLLPGACALAVLAQACAGGSPGRTQDGTAQRADEAKAIRARACARCHAPPKPSRHSRAELEVILDRHRTRARLTPEEWGSLVDLLARSDETPAPR